MLKLTPPILKLMKENRDLIADIHSSSNMPAGLGFGVFSKQQWPRHGLEGFPSFAAPVVRGSEIPGKGNGKPCACIRVNPRANMHITRDSISSKAPGPTCSKLSIRGLTCDSNADGGVCIVVVVALARLVFAVRAETPTSFVAVSALNVEARPDKTVYNRSTVSNGDKTSENEHVDMRSLASAWGNPGMCLRRDRSCLECHPCPHFCLECNRR